MACWAMVMVLVLALALVLVHPFEVVVVATVAVVVSTHPTKRHATNPSSNQYNQPTNQHTNIALIDIT